MSELFLANHVQHLITGWTMFCQDGKSIFTILVLGQYEQTEEMLQLLTEGQPLNHSSSRSLELMHDCLHSRDVYGCNVLWYATNKQYLSTMEYLGVTYQIECLPDYVSDLPPHAVFHSFCCVCNSIICTFLKIYRMATTPFQ
jgi:hypothetical protein